MAEDISPLPEFGSGDVAGSDSEVSVDMLTAALRADSGDLTRYMHTVSTMLVNVLPADMVEIDRDRSFSDRVSGRPGTVSALSVRFGDVNLELKCGRSALEGSVATVVRGVVLSRKPVAFAEWIAKFATELSRVANERGVSREALERFLLGN